MAVSENLGTERTATRHDGRSRAKAGSTGSGFPRSGSPAQPVPSRGAAAGTRIARDPAFASLRDRSVASADG